MASKQRLIGPVIEKKIPNQEAILTDDPFNIMSSGKYNKVPIMIGYTSLEGMFFMSIPFKRSDYCNIDFEDIIPYFMQLERGSGKSLNVARKLKEFYYGNKNVSSETAINSLTVRKFINYDITTNNFFRQMIGDIFIVRGIHVTIRNLLKTISYPIYLYKFAFDGDLNMYKKLTKMDVPGRENLYKLS